MKYCFDFFSPIHFKILSSHSVQKQAVGHIWTEADNPCTQHESFKSSISQAINYHLMMFLYVPGITGITFIIML